MIVNFPSRPRARRVVTGLIVFAWVAACAPAHAEPAGSSTTPSVTTSTKSLTSQTPRTSKPTDAPSTSTLSVAPSTPRTPTAPTTTDAPSTPTTIAQPSFGDQVLAPVTQTAEPSPMGIAKALEPMVSDPVWGSTSGGVVTDLASGQVLFQFGTGAALTPASNTKLLTALAALTTLGETKRFTTTVKLAGSTSIVLVGGGDPMLASSRSACPDPECASIDTLADKTAVALKGRGISKVALAGDANLFADEMLGPGWKPGDIPASTSKVSALTVDAGRIGTGENYMLDPATTALNLFASALDKRGITVRIGGLTVTPPAATTIASVAGEPVGEMVEHMLTVSDNTIAETLGRQISIAAGTSANFAIEGPTILAACRKAGLDISGAVLHDASGLARSNLGRPAMYAQVISLAASKPGLAPLLSGLAVSGYSGTLAARYRSVDTNAPEAGAGYVRAKTGTLSGVYTLSGYLTDRSGADLGFAFFVNNPAVGQDTAHLVQDAMTTRLLGCGCR